MSAYPLYKIIPNTPENLTLVPNLKVSIPLINSQYRARYMLQIAPENTTVGAFIFGNTLNYLVWLMSENEEIAFDLIGFAGVLTYATESDLLNYYTIFFSPTSI